MLVAVTCDRRLGHAGTGSRVRPPRREVWVSEATVDHLRAVGLTPVLLPPGGTDLDAVLAAVDGVVVTGGAFDIAPAHYGQAVHARIDTVDEARTGLELALVRACVRRGIPVLGLCGGLQAIVVATGGALLQDIAEDGGRRGVPVLDHEQPNDPAAPGHALVPTDGWAWLGAAVNSTHHQAADPARLGAVRAVAHAPDGTIEAVASDDGLLLGVQWHPELLHAPGACPIFAAFKQTVHRSPRALDRRRTPPEPRA